MYLFNMMDRQQLNNLFHTDLVEENDTLLDLGCGTGNILNHLVSQYECHGIGIDRINDNLVKQCSPLITYINGDLDNLPNCLKADLILSVDSLYFSNNPDALVQSLVSAGNNRLYVYYSQYIFDDNTKEKSVLHYDNTRIAVSLRKNKLTYRVVDYSANEMSLYENGLTLLPKYKNAFVREGNHELYETKLREYKSGKELYNKGLASRYLYIVA